ncbi:MAG: hypothetical protein HY796_04125 [Elusimicrobia bacterium]|nr:hypothetical protein [Elusimicrobiota bacterium]
MKILFSLLLLLSGAAGAQVPDEKSPAYASKSPVPSYCALTKDLGRFYMYANGGFNADWYVGYNNAWIIRLPPLASGVYARAYIGAKIGRAKIMSWPLSWDKTVIPGKIYLAISQEPGFSSDNMYFLVDSSDLPLEPLPNDSLDGIDSAQWFWTEIPLSKISAEKPNYLAAWSSSRYFISGSSAPIIAAAPSDDKEENVWLNRAIKGNPPSGEGVLETPISGIKPALAIKLVPRNDYKVIIKGFQAELDADRILVSFSAIGEDLRAVWLELSYDKFDWQKVSRLMFRAPYFFSFGREELSKDMFYLRAAAVDGLENSGYSKEIIIPAAPASEGAGQ